MDNFRFVILNWGGHWDDVASHYTEGRSIAAKFRGSTLEELKDCAARKIRVDQTRYDIVLKCRLIMGNSRIVQYTLQEDDCVDLFFSSVKEGTPDLDVEFVKRDECSFSSYDPYCGASVVIPSQEPFAPFAQPEGRLRTTRIPSAGERRCKVQCSRCGGMGHNRTNCQNARTTQPGSASTASVSQDTPARRACSVCRQVGHRRNRCPQINHS